MDANITKKPASTMPLTQLKCQSCKDKASSYEEAFFHIPRFIPHIQRNLLQRYNKNLRFQSISRFSWPFQSYSLETFSYMQNQLSWRQVRSIGQSAVAVCGPLQSVLGGILLIQRAAGDDALRRTAVVNCLSSSSFYSPIFSSTYTSIIVLSYTSHIILHHFSYRPPVYPNLSLGLASMLLPSLSTICSLCVRYLFGLIPNIYRTSTGHLPNMNGSCSLAASLLYWGYLLGILELFLRWI